MSIDRQRIAAVELLQALGYSWRDGEWSGKAAPVDARLLAAADAMHGALMDRVAALGGCTEQSEEEAEMFAIADALHAYEVVRWVDGVRGGG
jgi:hypothetical protein